MIPSSHKQCTTVACSYPEGRIQFVKERYAMEPSLEPSREPSQFVTP